MFIVRGLFGGFGEGHSDKLQSPKVTKFYKKLANTIPKIIIETLAILNLCPSLLSKIIVDEIWKSIPMTKAVMIP